jgi:hypothetical protein
MAEKDQDTTIITTDGSGEGGAAWFFVGAFVAIGLVLGYFYLEAGGDRDIDVSVDLPKVEAPDVKAPDAQ